jgi:hypothetical protein
VQRSLQVGGGGWRRVMAPALGRSVGRSRVRDDSTASPAPFAPHGRRFRATGAKPQRFRAARVGHARIRSRRDRSRPRAPLERNSRVARRCVSRRAVPCLASRVRTRWRRATPSTAKRSRGCAEKLAWPREGGPASRGRGDEGTARRREADEDERAPRPATVAFRTPKDNNRAARPSAGRAGELVRPRAPAGPRRRPSTTPSLMMGPTSTQRCGMAARHGPRRSGRERPMCAGGQRARMPHGRN